MPTPTETDRELCDGCAFAPGCAVRARSDGRVRCCDRFAPLDGVGGGEPRRPAPDARTRSAGLCRTCALNDTCERRHAEGGVWRCADYR